MNLAHNIKTLRKQHHMTQDDLAKKLNVSRQTISKWESHKTEPDIDTLSELSKIFHVSIDELIHGQYPDVPDIQEDNTNLQKDILKTQRKNHTLLVFITGVIVCFLCIFVVCPLFASLQQNDDGNYTGVTNISQQLADDSKLVSYLYVDCHITSLKKQTMLWKGQIDFYSLYLSKLKDQSELSMHLVYQDQSQENLDIYFDNETNLYAFSKEIPAKDISQIIIKAGQYERTFDQIAFPIEDYLYGIHLDCQFSSTKADSFTLECGIQPLRDYDDFRNSFESVIDVSIDDASHMTEALSDVTFYVKKNNDIVETYQFQYMEDLLKPFDIHQSFYEECQYEIIYHSPSGKEYQYTY